AVVRTTDDDGVYSDRLGEVSGTFDYQVCETDSGDCSNVASLTIESAMASTEAAGASLGVGEVPEVTELLGSYPNPFTASSLLRFSLTEATVARLVVYDAVGHEVARLVDGPVGAGYHEVSFDGARLPSGVYIVRLTIGSSFAQTRRLTLLK
ncbi:MAG: T9SS type A sorting domain-containing protein, partial [Rhodothermaceae bacterium]|nr:T9SS type A sorting domain-containing protein [Rhodothermaceae bacterium]